MTSAPFTPYREEQYFGNALRDSKITAEPPPPKLLLHAPHCAVQREHIQALMELFEIPEDQWPAHFEFFCYANGDQGSEEYTRRVAEILTSVEEVDRLVIERLIPRELQEQAREVVQTMSITALLTNCHRSILDLNRVFDYNPTDSRSQLTPPMPAFIPKLSPQSVDIAHKIHQEAMAIEERLYAEVCQPGRYGVLNAHTYMPINPTIQSFDTLYQEMHDIFDSDETYQAYFKNCKRPDIEFITATATGEVLAPPHTIGFLVDKFQRVGVTDISLNAPYYHVDSATCTQRSHMYKGWITIIEIARDLFLESRAPYRSQIINDGLLTIDPQQNNRLASAVAAAFLSSMILPV